MEAVKMNFSLFSTGPLYRFYVWLGLAKPPLQWHKRRIFAICLFAWLPLLILTLFSEVKISEFLSDFDIHVRLLISLALLLYAEIVANERFQIVVNQFINCDIIVEKDIPKYHKLIASAIKLSNSFIAEIILFVFVITIGRWVSTQVFPFDVSAWYTTKINNIVTLTPPGYWYTFVSLPLFQFILLRWYYRIIIWYRFIWKVSKLKLQLNSLHPDRSGGIGFLINSIYGLEPFLIAHSFLLAGIIFNLVFNLNLNLWDFKFEVITWLLILTAIPLLPMTFFIIQLARTKRNGTNEYSVIANRYVNEFRKKWIEPGSEDKKEFMGSTDIQSLADLANSFNVSAQMRILPFGRNTVLLILLFTALPLLPLLLTIAPMGKIIAQVIGVIF